MERKHTDIMVDLKSKHRVIADLIGDRGVHYVDLPMHGNIGDLLIMLGTMKFLAENRINCSTVASLRNYSSKWLGPDRVLLLHGGGNLGDLYPRFQSFRERMIEQLPKNRIIIFPQSIHFSSEQAFAKAAKIFSRHPDLHICTRDARSHALAKSMSANTYLLPDMAHQLYPLTRAGTAARGTLGLVRTDKESTRNVEIGADTITDWPEYVGSNFRLIRYYRAIARYSYELGAGARVADFQTRLWVRYAQRIVAGAVNLFSDHSRVVSDRLHAHILSCLLDMPNEIMDNSYGKNSTYINQWTGASPLVTLV